MRSSSYDEVEELFTEEKKVKKIKKTKVKSNKKGLIAGILAILVIILGFIAVKVLTPTIKLKGESKIKLTINSEYSDLGATAKFMGKDASSKIKQTGKVKTDKEGTYTITYSIKKLLFESKVKRTVSIVKDGPVINLEGDKDFSICPKAEYEEVGFTATNSKEEDLKDKVKTKVENELGWNRTYTFETGIKETIDWYVNNQDWIENIKSGEYKNAYKN